MKKIVAIGFAAVGVLWTLGQRKKSATVDTWAAGTDSV